MQIFAHFEPLARRLRAGSPGRAVIAKAVSFAMVGLVNLVVDFGIFSFAYFYLALPILVANVIAIFPDLWVSIFTDDAAVRATSRQYLSTAAPMYAFIGLAISMFFSSQGAAKVVGPVLAQSARLLFIAGGGWWLSMHNATAANFFALAAASMVVLGTLSAASVFLTRWGPKRAPVAEISPALSGVID